MPAEEPLLKAFLGAPLDPVHQTAYLEWLLMRGGYRGEYLRLLTAGLGEPTSPRPDDPVRRRLRKLLRSVGESWAYSVDRTRLVTNGVYQSVPSAEGWDYLRFYPDGKVVSVRSSAAPAEVWQRLNASDDAGAGPHAAYELGAGELSFVFPYRPPCELVRAWQDLKKELCSSYQPPEHLVQQLREFLDCPPDMASEQWRQQMIERLEQAMEELKRRYPVDLDESMSRLRYSGAIGPRTLCLQWRSEFTDTYSGVTTFWLAFTEKNFPSLALRPAEMLGESLPVQVRP